MLYDQFNRPLPPAGLKKPETRPLALAALRDRYSSYPAAGLTPERLAAIFIEADQGNPAAQAELFEAIELDPHIGAVLGTRKNAVMGVDLEITPASEASEDQRICEFVETELDRLGDLDETLLDLLDAIGKGYAAVEIDWQLSGGRATLGALRWVHPKRLTWLKLAADPWAPDDQTPRILTRENELEGIEVPPFKLIFHRYKARSGYDTRAGVLRVVAWMYLFKNYALKDWMTFSEVFGMPLRLGKYSPGASEDDRAALLAAVRNLGADAAGIISQATEIEFVHAVQSASQSPYETLCDWADRQCSKAILGQTLTTEVGASGSYAASQTHDGVRRDLLEADAKALARTLRDQLVRPLVGFNFGWDKELPHVAFPLAEAEDLHATAEIFGILKEKLGFPFTLEAVAERFKLRIPEAGETVLEGGKTVGSGELEVESGERGEEPLPMKAGVSRLALTTTLEAEADPVVLIGENLAQAAAPSEDAFIDTCKALLDEVESLEEYRDRLVEMFDRLAPADLGQAMGEALMLADLAGRFEVADGR